MNLEKLSVVDPELKGYIDAELNRQRDKIELIASENIVTPAVMEAMGSVLTNNMLKAIPVIVIMAAVNMLIRLKPWLLNVPKNYSMPNMLTYKLTAVPAPI